MPFWSLALAEVRSFAWACHTPSPIAHLLRSQLQALNFSFFRLTYYSERLNSSAAATLPHPKLISKNLGKFQGFANMKLSCRSTKVVGAVNWSGDVQKWNWSLGAGKSLGGCEMEWLNSNWWWTPKKLAGRIIELPSSTSRPYSGLIVRASTASAKANSVGNICKS